MAFDICVEIKKNNTPFVFVFKSWDMIMNPTVPSFASYLGHSEQNDKVSELTSLPACWRRKRSSASQAFTFLEV